MNEFERRALEIAQNSSVIAAIAREGRSIVNIDSFAYNLRLGTTAVPIAANAAASGAVQIQADSDFVLIYMSAGQRTAAQLTAQITDTGSGKTFFNEQTLIANIFGNGGFPFLMPQPRVINPSTNLKVDVTNLTATPETGLFMSFWGARIFYAGRG